MDHKYPLLSLRDATSTVQTKAENECLDSILTNPSPLPRLGKATPGKQIPTAASHLRRKGEAARIAFDSFHSIEFPFDLDVERVAPFPAQSYNGDNPFRSQLRPERNTSHKQCLSKSSKVNSSRKAALHRRVNLFQARHVKENVQNKSEVPVDEGISFDSLTQRWCKQQGALARCRRVKLDENSSLASVPPLSVATYPQ